MSAAEKLKDLFTKADSEKQKVEIDILQKKISEKLKNDPEAAKKAAMIIERMLGKQTKK